MKALGPSSAYFSTGLWKCIPIISPSLMNRLQRAQNCAARLVTYTRKADHITPTLSQLYWLPLRCRSRY